MGWTSPGIAAMFQQAMGEHQQTLARRVIHLREAKGWSRERLATEAGLSVKHVRRIEKAEVEKPQGDTFDALARALDVDVHELDAGRPTLAELEAQDGPLERIERKLDELLSRFPDDVGELLRLLREDAERADRRDEAPPEDEEKPGQ